MAEGARLESVYAVLSCIVGSNPTPSAIHKSLLYNGFSGNGMDSNLSRKFRGLRPLRLSVVAY